MLLIWSISNKAGLSNFAKDRLQDWKQYTSLSTQRAFAFLFAVTLQNVERHTVCWSPDWGSLSISRGSPPCPRRGRHPLHIHTAHLHASMPGSKEACTREKDRDASVGKALKNDVLQCSGLACHCNVKATTFGALVSFRAERGRWSCRGSCCFPPRRACQGFATSLFKSIMSCSLRKASNFTTFCRTSVRAISGVGWGTSTYQKGSRSRTGCSGRTGKPKYDQFSYFYSHTKFLSQNKITKPVTKKNKHLHKINVENAGMFWLPRLERLYTFCYLSVYYHFLAELISGNIH